MKVEYEVCDRCGEKLRRHRGLFSLLSRPMRLHGVRTVCGVTSSYSSLLCTDCTRDFDRWWEEGKVK